MSSSWSRLVFFALALLLLTAILFSDEVDAARRKKRLSKRKKKQERKALKVVEGPKEADETLILQRILELADAPNNSYPFAGDNNRMITDKEFYEIDNVSYFDWSFKNMKRMRPFGVTRVAYSKEDLNARAVIADWMTELGLEVSYDAIGNMFGFWRGREVYKGQYTNIVGVGSHIDIVPGGGRYEGVLGVLMALEAIRFMRAHGLRPKRSMELIVFASNEATRFGVPCIGSKAMSGTLQENEIEHLTTAKDMDGKTLLENILEAGFGKVPGIEDRDPTLREILEASYQRATSGPGFHRYSVFIEPHLETSHELDKARKRFGFAKATAGTYNVKVTLRGKGGHASTTNNKDRDGWDASTTMAEFLYRMEMKAYELGQKAYSAKTGEFSDLVTMDILSMMYRATPHRLEFTPNAVDIIPHTATVWYTFFDNRRMQVNAYKEQLYRDLRKLIPNGVAADIEITSFTRPQYFDKPFLAEITKEFEFYKEHYNIGTPGRLEWGGFAGANLTMYSHMDAAHMNAIVPSTVIMIPHLRGMIKTPREWVRPGRIAQGATLLSLQMRHFSYYTELDLRNNFNVTAALIADELMERQLGGNVTNVPLGLRGKINYFEDEKIRELEGDTPLLYDMPDPEL